MPRHLAIAQFFREFAVFDNQYVGMALRSLSTDPRSLETAERHLQLSARLTLLKRMAMARVADSPCVAELDGIIQKTARLQDKHEALTRNLAAVEGVAHGTMKLATKKSTSPSNRRMWLPTTQEIIDCNEETIELQQRLQSIAERLGNGGSEDILDLRG
jgi:hypothetical protein